MRIMRPGYEIMDGITYEAKSELSKTERVARNCYKSEGKITEDGESAKDLIGRLIDNGHLAMLEHVTLSVRFICDRGVSHELVRHRMASFSQESTRYCNYSNDKFGNQIAVIEPSYLKPGSKSYNEWYKACLAAEQAYMNMLQDHCSAQEARCVLPTCLKTEIIMTANYREWLHVLEQRTSEKAHPQMRELMLPLLAELHKRIPVIFDDLYALRFGFGSINARGSDFDEERNREVIRNAAKQEAAT